MDSFIKQAATDTKGVQDMLDFTKEELRAILKAHQLWLSGDASGKWANLKWANLEKANLEGANLKGANLEKANLEGANLEKANLKRANLYGADLMGANLKWANLEGANLMGANLYGTNLYGADLKGANLYGTNLYGADLMGANLYGTNLYGANLYGANLEKANLKGANLYGANLEKANLKGANLKGAILPHFQICPEEGDFIAWKKVSSGVVKLLIPKEARRTSSLVGRKCRAEFVYVLEGYGMSRHDGKTTYVPGETVYPDKYDDDIRVECTNGIHFFMTKREAEEY